MSAIITNTCLQIVDKLKWRASKYSDVFTQFVVSLFEDFNLDSARELVPKMLAEAGADMFLKPLQGLIEQKVKKAILNVLCQTEVKLEKISEIFPGEKSTEALLQEVISENKFSSRVENGSVYIESF